MKAALVLATLPSLILITAMGPAPRPTQSDPASVPQPVHAAVQHTRPASVRQCSALAASMPLKDQVGQLFMVGVDSNGLSRRTAAVLKRDRVGSIVLLGNTTRGTAGVHQVVAAAQRAAGRPGGVGLLAATDQEGGLVQRLRGKGFHRIPSARVQARRSNPALHGAAGVWGRDLRKAGARANLAPVADVVPAGMQQVNQPIGRLGRGYGSSPKVVAGRSSAVVRGYRGAGIATAAKHFPGLGAVRGNTDHAAHVVDRTTRRHDPRLAGFAATIAQGTDMVMVSSATYTRIDARRMALFSPTVMAMLRTDLRFRGVIVSDDVGVAVALRGVPARDRAVRFLGAGGDLVINASTGINHQMVSGVLERARHDPRFRARLTASTTRVLAMKAGHGLVSCR